jgi:hypothetical protein
MFKNPATAKALKVTFKLWRCAWFYVLSEIKLSAEASVRELCKAGSSNMHTYNASARCIPFVLATSVQTDIFRMQCAHV